jgi:nitroimidazol reductase NimA-like FMN-containing flavoprotein (pyridoxamine 5'-phosphate oxidase superfamily)
VTTATTLSLPSRGQLNRADKVMRDDEIDAFLTTSFCGRTATIGADGYPYVVPNLFVWHDSTVFLHTARRSGHFAANVRNSDRVSFETVASGEVFPYGDIECDTSVSYRSVVLFGRIRVVDCEDEAAEFFRRFMTKYAPADSWGREKESFPRILATTVYAIEPDAITGKHGVLPPVSERWPQKNNTLSPNWKRREPSSAK